MVEMLLELHLQYMAEFGNGVQSVDWMTGKAVGHKKGLTWIKNLEKQNWLRKELQRGKS